MKGPLLFARNWHCAKNRIIKHVELVLILGTVNLQTNQTKKLSASSCVLLTARQVIEFFLEFLEGICNQTVASLIARHSFL